MRMGWAGGTFFLLSYVGKCSSIVQPTHTYHMLLGANLRHLLRPSKQEKVQIMTNFANAMIQSCATNDDVLSKAPHLPLIKFTQYSTQQ